MANRTRVEWAFAAALAAVATVVLYVTALYGVRIPLLPIALLGVLHFVSESFTVELYGTSAVSVGSASIVAAVVLGGPLAAAVVALCGAVTPTEIKQVKAKSVLVMNASIHAVAAATAGWIYLWLGGKAVGTVGAHVPLQLLVVPLFCSAAVLFVLNDALVSVVILVRHGASAARGLLRDAWHWVPNYIALTILGLVLAQVYVAASVLGVVLTVVPLAIARQTFQVYMKLREAYQGTVRSLVAAIEAKDAYTRGHSERVADYSEQIARQLHLPEDDIDKLKFAALLHDLGKIGIQRRILSKVGRLSPDEFTLMREHPELAATILRNVEFLEDVIPTIYHHHEHYNGDGYQGHLKGEQIPLAARILSVADAYDAMTSARPYRGALTPEAAAAELVSCCGSQFDRRVVNALLAAVEVQPEPARVSEPAKGQLSIIEETD